MTVACSRKQQLQQLCEAQGQLQLLDDWDSLTSEQQQKLAADIQVCNFKQVPLSTPSGASCAECQQQWLQLPKGGVRN
jgi:hypothetical protein